MNFLKSLQLVSVLFFSGATLSAQNNWVLKKDKDGIKISTRPSSHSKFNAIKVEMDLPGNIYQLVGILTDIPKYTEWCYSIKQSVVVKKPGTSSLIYYSEINTPWPATNRDLYSFVEISIDSSLHTLKVVSLGKKDYRPVNKNLVRIPYSRAVWDVTTISIKAIRLTYILEVDPGGSVPAWIMNLFATKAPFETFENLKHQMMLLN
jgi:START domain